MSDQFINIDINSTKITITTFQNNKFSESQITHTKQSSQNALIKQLTSRIKTTCKPNTQTVNISLPSVIEFTTKRILSSMNIPLKNLPLRELLTSHVGIPIYIKNNTSCATLAETFENSQLTYPELIMFTINTNISNN